MLEETAERRDVRRQVNSAVRIFTLWANKTKAIVFERRNVMVRLQRNALHHWLIRSHTVAVEYEGPSHFQLSLCAA
jgi:hypothetical protein